MFVRNVAADPSDYYTQNNNRWIPHEACGPESAAMALDLADIIWWYPKIMQPGDYITACMNSKPAWEKLLREHPDLYDAGLRPHNTSPLLAWGLNQIVGRHVDTLMEDASMQEVLWHLFEGRPLIMSGSFTKSGHFVVVTGFSSMQHEDEISGPGMVDLDKVDYVLVSDPHGNYHTKYQNPNGWNVMFELMQFNDLTNTPGNLLRKRIHIIDEEEWP